MTMILGENKERQIPPGWELAQIRNLAEIHGGSTPSTSDSGYWEDGNILWATPTDITSLSSKFISDTHRKISEKAVDETGLRLCEPGTLLMTSRATIGYPAIADKQITTNQGFINIHCGHKLEVLFFYYWIIQNRTLLERYSQGSTFLELSKKDFRKFHIPLPPLPEQRKIADILSTVDETIENTDAIIQETQQLKKGLMQKLFTEGIGHTRFRETKIGRIPEGWRAIQIGDFSKIRRGASPRPIGDTKYFAENGRGWVRIADVTSSGKKLQRTSQYLSDLGASLSVPVNPGDLIMSICATIGKPIIVDMEACIHDGFVLFSHFHNAVLTDYLYYLLQLLERSFTAKGQEGTQKNLNTDLVRKTYVPLPPLDEQQRIAEILSEVDAKIETEHAFKAELEQLKKGLMQVLLTGKVRVKV